MSFAEQVTGPLMRFLIDRFGDVGRSTQGASLLDLYRTVLGGNPNANINGADAFGTTPANALDDLINLREIALRRFGLEGAASLIANAGDAVSEVAASLADYDLSGMAGSVRNVARASSQAPPHEHASGQRYAGLRHGRHGPAADLAGLAAAPGLDGDLCGPGGFAGPFLGARFTAADWIAGIGDYLASLTNRHDPFAGDGAGWQPMILLAGTPNPFDQASVAHVARPASAGPEFGLFA